MVEPTASMEGAWWVVFDHPEQGEKFYSSHDSRADADELAAAKNAEEGRHPWPYKVVAKH